MALLLGKKAIAEALKDALKAVHKVPVLEEKSDGVFVYKERDDGANTHELFEAKISPGLLFADTKIYLTPVKISLTDIRKITKRFFKTNGECLIDVP